MRIQRLLASLLLSAGCISAVAQMTAPDPACPLKGSTPAVSVRPKLGILVSKNPGPHECKSSNQCKSEVEVESFTRANGEAACCLRTEWELLTPKRANKDVTLRWDITSVDGGAYVFKPSNAIVLISPPPTQPNDFRSPITAPGGKKVEMVAINGRLAGPFSYEIHVFKDLGQGRVLACDVNDPLIANQGP